MGKEKINHYINMDQISKEIMTNDFKNLRNIENFGYDVPDYFKPSIQKIEQATTLEEVVNQLGELFDKLAKDQKYDLAMVIQNFLQRYTYFLATKHDYDAHAENISSSVLEGHNSAEVFSAVYVPFFSQQIDFYAGDFIDKLNEFGVVKWNADFYNKLLNELQGIINQKDFIGKLELIEKFIMDNSDPDELYKALNMSSENPDPEKEAFATAFNEFKIILQSTDNLIEVVIKELKKVLKEN